MEKKKQMKLLDVLQPLKMRTRVCKICFKDFKKTLLSGLFNDRICHTCYKEMNPNPIRMTIDGVKGYGIYEYNEKIKSMIYLYKGCGDIELKDVFINKFVPFLRLRYFSYYVTYIPSNKEDDEQRGFNHVKEIGNALKLKELHLLKKNTKFKQSSLDSKERSEVKDKIGLIDKSSLKGKKILIIDDIITTGSTMKTSIELIKSLNPKKIEFLSISYSCRKMTEKGEGKV